jgi:hypothetical protein
MYMPLRDGGLFSQTPDMHGTIDYEIGSYALDWQEMQNGKVHQQLIRLDGIGEFAVPEEAIRAAEAQIGGRQIDADERARIILGKMLEKCTEKLWAPSNM